jgi:type I restriction enzyme S subunit
MAEPKLGPGHVVPTSLPPGWTVSRLGDLVDVVQGGRLGLTKEKDHVSDGVVAFSAAGPDGFVGQAEFTNRTGVILSAIGANCGRCFYAEGDWTTLANVQAILPRGYIDARFLYYRVNDPEFWERSGSAQPFIKPSSIKKAWVAYPRDSTMQAAIAQILSTIDTQIAATQVSISKHEQVRCGLMHDLFTRGVDENGQLRPRPEEAPRLYHKTECGPLPLGWHVRQVREFCRVKGGKRVPVGEDFSVAPTAFPYLRVVDLTGGSVDTSELRYVTPEVQKLIARYTISKLDLYVTIAGTIGLVGGIPRELHQAQLTENAAKLSDMNFQVASLPFLKRVMMSQMVQKQIWREIGTGGGVPKLALFRIEALRVPLPPLREQRQIALCLGRCERTIGRARELAKRLRLLKAGLMQDLLTGKVSVAPLLEAAEAA